MLPKPWKALQQPESGKEYVAMLSFLPLKRYTTIPRFLLLSFETERQLQQAKGVVGYSLQAELLRRRFWTLSAWEDAQSLREFVQAIPHGEIMEALSSEMGETKFAQWTVSPKDIPLRWDDAKARLK